VNRGERDLKDLRRIKKRSFDWYRQLIAANGRLGK
jgi:6-phospho-beta-glucosidase